MSARTRAIKEARRDIPHVVVEVEGVVVEGSYRCRLSATQVRSPQAGQRM